MSKPPIAAAPPPLTPQPNVFPLDWPDGDPITHQLFKLAKREAWDAEELPWDELREAPLSSEERLGIGYWFSMLGIFDAAAPPVFAHALIELYKAHEEDGVRKCFSTILRDELNHEEVCRFGTQLTLPGSPRGPLLWTPREDWAFCLSPRARPPGRRPCSGSRARWRSSASSFRRCPRSGSRAGKSPSRISTA